MQDDFLLKTIVKIPKLQYVSSTLISHVILNVKMDLFIMDRSQKYITSNSICNLTKFIFFNFVRYKSPDTLFVIFIFSLSLTKRYIVKFFIKILLLLFAQKTKSKHASIFNFYSTMFSNVFIHNHISYWNISSFLWITGSSR